MTAVDFSALEIECGTYVNTCNPGELSMLDETFNFT